MGYDISNHPVDAAFIRQRLIPALKGHGNVEHFIERAARLAVVAHQAKAWGMQVMDVSHRISDLQRALDPKDTPAPTPALAKPASVWGRLKQALSGGGAASAPDAPPARAWRLTTGLPGFDTDRSVWGRPFFVTERSPEAAVAVVERYMACSADDPHAMDAIARAQVALLEARRHEVRPDVLADTLAVLDGFYPLMPHVEPDASGNADEEGNDVHESDDEPTDAVDADEFLANARTRLKARFDLLRAVWAARDSQDPFEHPLLDEPGDARELALELPYTLIDFAAKGLPGWMGRGYVWPTALFEQIGVPVDHLFETPAALFDELRRDLPQLESRLHTSIPENYSLGGYVRPENIAAFEALLRQHRRELILAWQDDKNAADAELEEMCADFDKILEPVIWARANGWGFIEGAEIYSGFMGITN